MATSPWASADGSAAGRTSSPTESSSPLGSRCASTASGRRLVPTASSTASVAGPRPPASPAGWRGGLRGAGVLDSAPRRAASSAGVGVVVERVRPVGGRWRGHGLGVEVDVLERQRVLAGHRVERGLGRGGLASARPAPVRGALAHGGHQVDRLVGHPGHGGLTSAPALQAALGLDVVDRRRAHRRGDQVRRGQWGVGARGVVLAQPAGLVVGGRHRARRRRRRTTWPGARDHRPGTSRSRSSRRPRPGPSPTRRAPGPRRDRKAAG